MNPDHPNYRPTQRFAATSPEEEADQQPPLSEIDRDLDALCEKWVYWCRTRRLYGPPPVRGTVLGRMSGSPSRPMKPGGPDAISSAELSALHIAYTGQPPDALDRQVFDAYYVLRVKPVKRAADALGVSRAHFYDVLREFRQRIYFVSQGFMDKIELDKQAMEEKRDARNRGEALPDSRAPIGENTD